MSTRKTITSKPITLDCFEIDDFNPELNTELVDEGMVFCFSTQSEVNCQIDFLESLRQKYLETNNKAYWKELIRWVPESWLQTRTVTMTYENLFAMCSSGQRRYHKLNEWSGVDVAELPNFISWARTLPYAKEFIFIDELEV